MTLKEELLRGSRLCHPPYGPPNICHMMQTCWLDLPDARPSFTNIKSILYNDPQMPKLLANKNQGFYLSLDEGIEDAMEVQYRQIRKCNPMYDNGQDKTEDAEETSNGAVCTETTHMIGGMSNHPCNKEKIRVNNSNWKNRVQCKFNRNTLY